MATKKKMLQAAAGSGGIVYEYDYWISTLGGTGVEYAESVAVDSSDNIYVTGYTASTGAGDNDILIAKYNSSSYLEWKRTLGGTGTDNGYGIAVDSSDNIYVAGTSSYEALLAKYDSSGTIQWQRTLGGTGIDNGRAVAVDSSDNIIIVGDTYSTGAGGYDLLIAKYNSSGSIQWQRTLGGASTERGYSVTTDSSDNIIVTGYTNSTGTNSGSLDLLIAKYNSSGSIQWQRVLGGTTTDVGNGVAVDSSNNIIVTGYTTVLGLGGVNNYNIIIAKYNSSGTIQWQRELGNTGSMPDFGNGVTTDSSNNIFIVGRSGYTYDLLIAKYNSSGTIQWQRSLGGTNDEYAGAVALDSSQNIIVFSQTKSAGDSDGDFLLAKLPSDGTGTGTYGAFNYQSVSRTDAASSLTDASISLTDASSSLTDQSSSRTDAAASLTASIPLEIV
jgi:uncharacterized delta-60 repeat protein